MKRNNLLIAITGGIGSGKSVFSDMIRKKGFPVYSCDEIYTELLKNENFLHVLRETFPSCVNESGLNRTALAEIVFSDPAALRKLNSITHPQIMRELFRRAESFKVSFAEVPLLFEEGLENMFDSVIALRRPDSDRIASVILRDGLSEGEIIERIKLQFKAECLSEKNCYIIENDGTLFDLKKKADEIIGTLKNMFPKQFTTDFF